MTFTKSRSQSECSTLFDVPHAHSLFSGDVLKACDASSITGQIGKGFFFKCAPWLTFAYQVLEIRLGRMQEWP